MQNLSDLVTDSGYDSCADSVVGDPASPGSSDEERFDGPQSREPSVENMNEIIYIDCTPEDISPHVPFVLDKVDLPKMGRKRRSGGITRFPNRCVCYVCQYCRPKVYMSDVTMMTLLYRLHTNIDLEELALHLRLVQVSAEHMYTLFDVRTYSDVRLRALDMMLEYFPTSLFRVRYNIDYGLYLLNVATRSAIWYPLINRAITHRLCSPLQIIDLALAYNDVTLLRMFILMGGNINCLMKMLDGTNNSGTPLRAAILYNKHRICRYLFLYHANLTQVQVCNGVVSLIQLPDLPIYDYDSVDESGWTINMKAAYNHDYRRIQTHPSINIQDPLGVTPLIHALTSCVVDLIKPDCSSADAGPISNKALTIDALLKAGADPNLADFSGKRPLWYALHIDGLSDISLLLIRHGALLANNDDTIIGSVPHDPNGANDVSIDSTTGIILLVTRENFRYIRIVPDDPLEWIEYD